MRNLDLKELGEAAVEERAALEGASYPSAIQLADSPASSQESGILASAKEGA